MTTKSDCCEAEIVLDAHGIYRCMDCWRNSGIMPIESTHPAESKNAEKIDMTDKPDRREDISEHPGEWIREFPIIANEAYRLNGHDLINIRDLLFQLEAERDEAERLLHQELRFRLEEETKNEELKTTLFAAQQALLNEGMARDKAEAENAELKDTLRKDYKKENEELSQTIARITDEYSSLRVMHDGLHVLKDSVSASVYREVKKENAELKAQLEDIRERFDDLCNRIWEKVYPGGKAGSWDYGAQAVTHFLLYCDELKTQVEKLKAELEQERFGGCGGPFKGKQTNGS